MVVGENYPTGFFVSSQGVLHTSSFFYFYFLKIPESMMHQMINYRRRLQMDSNIQHGRRTPDLAGGDVVRRNGEDTPNNQTSESSQYHLSPCSRSPAPLPLPSSPMRLVCPPAVVRAVSDPFLPFLSRSNSSHVSSLSRLDSLDALAMLAPEGEGQDALAIISSSHVSSLSRLDSLDTLAMLAPEGEGQDDPDYTMMKTPDRNDGTIRDHQSPDVNTSINTDEAIPVVQKRLFLNQTVKESDHRSLEVRVSSPNQKRVSQTPPEKKRKSQSSESLLMTPTVKKRRKKKAKKKKKKKRKPKDKWTCVRSDGPLYYSLDASQINHHGHSHAKNFKHTRILNSHVKYRNVRVVMERFTWWERQKR